MSRIVVVNFISLDGVIQSPLSDDDDLEGGFTGPGWVSRTPDETVGQFMQKSTTQAGGMLLGRKTYQSFTAVWSNADENNPAVAAMNTMPKYVATRTLTTAEWANTRILGPDLPAELRRLKEQPGGDITVFGSGNLLQTLTGNDLVDEYRLLVYPVILGRGKRMFTDAAAPANLRLADSVICDSGVAIHTYERIGSQQPGQAAQHQ